MRIQLTTPPAAAPLTVTDLLRGLLGLGLGRRYRKQLEQELREYFGVRYVFLVSSGKAGLALVLSALRRISDRREVVIPAYTCFSVPSAVVKAGLRVRPCEVNPKTGDFDLGELPRVVSDATLCVIPTHLFGIAADVESVREICRARGVFVVEDAAQAMGVRHRGQLLGTLGDAGLFSLGRGKNITCGSGGIVLCDSPRLGVALAAEYGRLEDPGLIRSVRNAALVAGMWALGRPFLYWLPAGLPFLGLGRTCFYRDFHLGRLGGFEAGLLGRWRKRLEDGNHGRLESARELQRAAGCETGDVPYLRLPLVMPSRVARDALCELSRRRGLGMAMMYPTSIGEIPELRDHIGGRKFEVARMLADRILTMPTHHLVPPAIKRELSELICGHRILGAPPADWSSGPRPAVAPAPEDRTPVAVPRGG
jgi:dTDP-4-amino-4,6-dideoxygalactose transaminase